MKILLAGIPEEGVHFTGSESAEILELEEEPHFRGIGPVDYEVFVERVSEQLIARGRVGCELDIQCARCAEFFSTRVEDSSFLRAYEIPPDQETVDMGPDLREAILLSLPAFPVCREDCAGLCARCGANLNRERCRCVSAPEEVRWDALDSLNLSE
jgi:uncharacterized protein